MEKASKVLPASGPKRSGETQGQRASSGLGGGKTRRGAGGARAKSATTSSKRLKAKEEEYR